MYLIIGFGLTIGSISTFSAGWRAAAIRNFLFVDVSLITAFRFWLCVCFAILTVPECPPPTGLLHCSEHSGGVQNQ